MTILRRVLQRLDVVMDVFILDGQQRQRCPQEEEGVCVCVCVCVCVSTRGVADRLWTMKTTGLGADLMALTASS